MDNFTIFAKKEKRKMSSMEIDMTNQEMRQALHLVAYTQESVFLTGKAGTGKSTFLNYLRGHLRKKHVVLAPTGIAAVNVGGSTIHSFFHLPFHPLLPDDERFMLKGNKLKSYLKYNKEKQKLIRELELIIIDEISMVRADVIDFIDQVLRCYTGIGRPFGGKQMLFVGDVYQLEPVAKPEDWRLLSPWYTHVYFFSANVFKQLSLIAIELQRVYRQNDPEFIELLNHIRTNTADQTHLDTLNKRVITTKRGEPDMAITLAAHRDRVNAINRNRLDKLPGECITFKGSIDGDFPISSLPTDMDLSLKEQAQVIFIKNDPLKRWVNGTTGLVQEFDEENEALCILKEDGIRVFVKRECWSNTRYYFDHESQQVKEEILGTFTQYPIKLAWAITVHKSQGMTLKRVVIDLGAGAFAGGQTYVALSRCTSLSDISLIHPVTREDIFVDPAIIAFAQTYNDRATIDAALASVEADIAYSSAFQAFDKGQFDLFIRELLHALQLRDEKDNPTALRLMRMKLQHLWQYKEQQGVWKEVQRTQWKKLEKYAEEYYAMGNECLEQLNDPKAALANYRKSLEMNPKHVCAWVNMGIAYYRDNEVYEAEKCLNQAVILSPFSFRAVYQRGLFRYKQGNIDGAIADLDRAVALKPEHVKAHEHFGDALSKAGKMEEAADQWDLADRLREERNNEHNDL